MKVSKTLLVIGVACAMFAGCKKHDSAAAAAPEASKAADAAAATKAAEAPAAAPAAPQAKAFDINSVPVSDKPLPAWPYVALPAGYVFRNADELATRSKDLARVPVWTGGQIVWVEGKVFADEVTHGDGKTFSQFELRKNLQQAVEALGGKRVSEHSYDEATYKANEKALESFRNEFSAIREAYWYDQDADTYVIRRADKAIWIVVQANTSTGGLMVAEGPLPEAPAK